LEVVLDITWDIEANNLLNNTTIDYTASPYCLKPTFAVHCIVVEEHQTGKLIAFYDGDTYELDGRVYAEQIEGQVYKLEDYLPITYTHKQLSEFPKYIEETTIVRVVAHNSINYDHLVAKLYFGMNYTIAPDSWAGKKVNIVDTMVLSKTLNPDRFGGHSLDKLSEKVGLRKIDFRPNLPSDKKFTHFAADMLYYCIRDVKVNTLVYKYLKDEWVDWDWKDAYQLEKAVAEIITRQEHRGFHFNKDLAEANIEELDRLLEERRSKIEPILPEKDATQAFMKDYTPPVKQLKSNLQLTAYMEKFLEKHGGSYNEAEGTVELFGITHKLPLPVEPLITKQKASVEDTTHIKEWLVRDFGWRPSEYAEKDISVNTKKIKLAPDKLEATIARYVEQTLSSAFMLDRCDFLETTPKKLLAKLSGYKQGRAIKVITNPKFTRGQEKEICPDLLRIAKDFPYAKDIVEYLTYKHRRNSILGGGLEWEDEEVAEKGYLSFVRDDQRIPTPADTCGAATSRFKHRVVANIPRVTSLYGEKMRGLFGVADGFTQIGYDFDSLEARIESHYCWNYDTDKEYCNSLTQDKPNDVHTKLSLKISDIIGRAFARSPAKSVKYGCTYGSSPPKVAKIIGSGIEEGTVVFNAFWLAAMPLKLLKDALQAYWEATGKKFIKGIDGRKVPTRSAHAILNSLFQSGGVICAKRAMVIHDRKLKAEGLLVDFFIDDWKNLSFCNQLVAYHDEAQLEVSSSLIQWRVGKTKEDIVKLKQQLETETGKIWSDVGHIGEKYYIGYCRAGELAVESVLEAGRYYNLNVDLTAGYMLGKDWGSCH